MTLREESPRSKREVGKINIIGKSIKRMMKRPSKSVMTQRMMDLIKSKKLMMRTMRKK